MRAAVLTEPNRPLVIEDIPKPRPGIGEILMRVEACGVCHTDLHVMKGDVAFPYPAVLGHEAAGEVVELGEGVEGLTPGDKVVTSFIMPCLDCRYCAEGRDDLCDKFFGMNRLRGTLYDGASRLARENGETLAMYSMAALSEFAVVPVSAAYLRPPGSPPESSAILGCAFFTAFGAVHRRANLEVGESVAVLGVGGVGLAIVQFARVAGASRLIAVDLDERKLELARVNGATDIVNGADINPVDAVRDLTEGGVEVVFEAIGLAPTWVQGVEMLKDGGRMVAVGIGSLGSTAPIEITRLVRRSLTVVGSYGARVRADMPQVVSLAARGEIKPELVVTETYQLGDADAAYQALDRGDVVGRAVILTG